MFWTFVDVLWRCFMTLMVIGIACSVTVIERNTRG